MMLYLKISIVLLFGTMFVENAKILGVFHFPSKSHHILGSSLLKALADKGHEVTMISPFPLQKPYPNYEDIEIKGMIQYKEENIIQTIFQMQNQSYASQMFSLISKMEDFDRIFLNDNSVKNFVASKRKFDIIILCWFGSDVHLAFAHQFEGLVVAFSPVGSTFMTNKITMNPTPYSYVPNLFISSSSEMTFLQRIFNTVTNIATDLYGHFYMSYKQELLRQEYFPNSPSIDELQANISLVLLNSHYSIESPRPYVPNMIQIGGFHLKEPKQLPKDLEKFMNSAHDGVIYFSLGSNARSADLPNEKVQEIVKCFSTLPLHVLWKWEADDSIPGLPKNVMVRKWLPQTDILAHKNIRLFITHGGLLSTTEAVYHGVPMIGIPLFGDQQSNVEDSANKGYLVKVSFLELNHKQLCNAINEIWTNPKYRNNIKQRSLILRDQPNKPMDNALFWIEYVLRHKGARHLQTSAIKLRWYQYYLVDVVGAVLGILLAITLCFVFIMYKICTFVKRNIFKTKSTAKKSSKNKKSKQA